MTAVGESAMAAADSYEQPYDYRRAELSEPDWHRFPGWRDITSGQWRTAQWRRENCVRGIKQLRQVMGNLLDERFYEDLAADQRDMGTMSMLQLPPMLHTTA